MKRKFQYSFLIYLFFLSNAFAAIRTVDLHVNYKTVNFAGKIRKAIAVNDQIPAPTLHFKIGDQVKINVYNHLDKGTAIHWHGIIVPWQMDGVEGVTQQPIPPGGIFHYQFTLHQAGTYWYHAHSGVQEQEGLYGAFLIDPPQPPPYHTTKDYVIVLSDWSNLNAENIFANLKKSGDYFSPKFPLQPSLIKFLRDYRQSKSSDRKQLIDDYKMMQQMRMSIYDLSDVAYDSFLLNGRNKKQPWTARVKVGDTVRLRFIGAGGSTIFHVKIHDTKIQMVHVQGNDVKPYWIQDFRIAPGETYDVLVKIKKKSPYIIYAESFDTLGAAVGALITSPQQKVNYSSVPHFPEPLPVTREMMKNMMTGMDHTSMNHSMHSMEMPTESTQVGDVKSLPTTDLMKITTTGTKYQDLKAALKTNDPNKAVYQVIRMELFGYMNRFIWFINGLPEYKTHPIVIEPNQRYRLIFTNNSMMRHPMHVHGHWFILRNGHYAYDPLVHTIEVLPGATVVADIDADESGQWFFHCHHLYHMMSGMSRVFQYSTLIEIEKGKLKPQYEITDTRFLNRPIVRVDEQFPLDHRLIMHPMAHPMGLFFANFLDVGEDPFHNVQRMNFKGLYGFDYDKLELLTEDAEINKGTVENADLDIFYWHLVRQFWALKGGANIFSLHGKRAYWQPGVGVEGLLPYFIDTDIRTYYHAGAAKFDLEFSRDTQIANNFLIRLGIRSILGTKTVIADGVGSGLNQMRFLVRPYYRVTPAMSLFSEYEHEEDYGDFKKNQRIEGEPVSENTLTFGFSLLF